MIAVCSNAQSNAPGREVNSAPTAGSSGTAAAAVRAENGSSAIRRAGFAAPDDRAVLPEPRELSRGTNRSPDTNAPLAPHSTDMEQLEVARERMVSEQLIARGITNQAVLAAMRKVPRFLPYEVAANRFEDKAVDIRYGRTVESPYVVASVAEQLDPDPQSPDRVLELGTGSGYETAVLSLVVAKVYSVETNAVLARRTRVDLQNNGYTNNIELRVGDPAKGWPEAAPFDAIIVNGTQAQVSDTITSQLKEGGKLIIQVDENGKMQIHQKFGSKLISLKSRQVHLPQKASNLITLPPTE